MAKLNFVKYNAICPNYAYYLPCASTINKEWCCFEHNPSVRAMNDYTTNVILNNLEFSEEAYEIIVSFNTKDEIERKRN